MLKHNIISLSNNEVNECKKYKNKNNREKNILKQTNGQNKQNATK